jgi:hypothetical protein
VSPPSHDGLFKLDLPEGHYDVRQGSVHTTVTILPGGIYDVDLRPDHVLDFKVTSQNLGHNEVTLRISSEGAGHHTFAIRTDNLTLTEPPQQEVNLTSAGPLELVWHAHSLQPNTPWVAVVIPDGTLTNRRELTGSIAGTPSSAGVPPAVAGASRPR